MPGPGLLRTFDPTAILMLNLAGVFVFGLSGALAGIRARLDPFGVLVLAIVVGLTGGIVRDVLIGRPPATFRDPRYLAVLGRSAAVALIAHPMLQRARVQRTIDVLDAAGLGLFCVTGASIALQYHLAAPEAIVLGMISGIGGGMLRDLLLREVPHVLRGGLYAVPALAGATIAVLTAGSHDIVFAVLAVLACFGLRVAALRFELGLPRLPYQA